MSKNVVHLDGILESLQVVSATEKETYAWASFVTLHARSGMVNRGVSPSELYEKMRHDIRVIATGEDSAKRLKELSGQVADARKDAKIFSCELDGHIVSNGEGSFVYCKADYIKPTETIKTNGNNRVIISGEVVSTSFTNESATIKVKTDQGVVDNHFLRKSSLETWDLVSRGSIRKGESITFHGPLVSMGMTNGNTVRKYCMVTPTLVQRTPSLTEKRRKSGPSLG